MLDLQHNPHRRYNPLTGEWLLVSPHRTARPWQGQVETVDAQGLPDYDAQCYLCPGNQRAGGVRNPQYTSTFVFDNDFPTLKPETAVQRLDDSGLLVAESEPGISRVVCFSPRHNLTLADLDAAEMRLVVDTWIAQFQDLGAQPLIQYVQLFENRGAMMGASNPHPHCQIWSNHSVPTEVMKEQHGQRQWLHRHGSCLLCGYAKLETEKRIRVVDENETFLSLVPYWAVWPFETMVLAKRHVAAIEEFSDAEREGLADILKRVTTRYDRVFDTPFPYSMGFHQRPTDGAPHDEWHFHAHFHPPLLRSATVRKFVTGYEFLANPTRDITAEAAAERLRRA